MAKKKEDLFSKLNIKDYNNQLEDVLENKPFSESAKNILLNILYKMESAYDDYKKVKVDVNLKKEFLERIINIIQDDCKDIEIIRPKINGDTKLGDKNYIVDKKEGKIISYPNDKNVFYALNNLSDSKFVLDDKYTLLKEPMEKLLNQGYINENNEIIRDFDGWTWNIIHGEISNYIYNLIYQNIRILVGNEFLQGYIESNKITDFVKIFEDKLNSMPGNNTGDIEKAIYKVAILENIKQDKANKEYVLNLKDELKTELSKIENKKEYIHEIAASKKIIEKRIKEIDETLNNNLKLRENFAIRNKKLKGDKQIFSLSEYVDLLQNEREKILIDLDEYNYIMNPQNYSEKKSQLRKILEIIGDFDNNMDIEKEINIELIFLQKRFLKIVNEKCRKIQEKKEIIEYIYLFRYYKLIYIDGEKQIKDIEELKEDLKKTEKHIITKACKLRAMNILCQDIESNYQLVSKILNRNIIELEDVTLEVKKHEKNIVVTVYDEETIQDSIIYDGNERLNIKYNRKIKLFI